MKDSITDYDREFEELVGDLSDVVHEMSDPVAIGSMLYSIAEERKSSNLVIRDINGKFDNLVEKLRVMESVVDRLDRISDKLDQLSVKGQRAPASTNLSARDEEILSFVRKNKVVCADNIQEKFRYRGRNAASARLSKLFKDNLLEKEYRGRNVYYKLIE
ncbi:MAG: hypothetical protein KAU03_00265 [Candidatus Altiarchaeales archaeon]|nr:hypothetical protein [Candidatus Altiarchaeales archaeon]